MIEVDLHALGSRIGQEIAVSDWLDIPQARIDQLAEATGDHQWIHVDPIRAAVESPYRTTVAHGFLTLSLLSTLARSALSVGQIPMAVNYGINRARFIAPVPVGSRIRGRFTPSAVEQVGHALQVTWNVIVEREGGDKPCAVVDWIIRYYLL